MTTYSREELRRIYLEEDYKDIETIGTGRWTSSHWMIFEDPDEGALAAPFEKGLSDSQDTRPFDSNHPEMIKCFKVKETKRLITEWIKL